MRDQQTIAILRKAFRGNDAAVELALMLVAVADVWDDLVDKDCEVQEDEINRAMMICLSGIPRNAFYCRHMSELVPVMETSIANWMAANVLEKCKDNAKALEVANVIRHDLASVFVHMARLIGGLEWAAEVAPEIRMLAQNDSLAEFLKE